MRSQLNCSINMAPDDYCKALYEHCGSPSGVIIKYSNPPVYISNLNISSQQSSVIVIYKEVKQLQAQKCEVVLTNTEDVTDSLADLSVTGQPLECPFDADDTLNLTLSEEPVTVSEDHLHGPLTLLEARRILSIVNLKLVPPAPVWVLTDAVERGRTFLLGSEVTKDWRKRSWATAHSNQVDKVPIKHMLDDFEKTFNIGSGWKVSSSVCCVFNIKDQPGMAQNCRCLLEARWQRPSHEVPVSQADTTLVVECTVGQEQSQLSRWWRQLTLLQEYVEIIQQRRQSRGLQDTYQRNSISLPSLDVSGGTNSDQGSKAPLVSRVRDLIQRSDSMSVCRQLGSSLNTTSALNSTIQELLTDKQKGQDFTDRLWSLLIEAKTYQELAECFQMVLKDVRKQSMKPYMFAKNGTRLASVVRGRAGAGGAELGLMLEPLELMVEMGLEKLKRDYMFMFLASHIATEDSLTIPRLPSFVEVGTSEWPDTVSTWLCWLSRLHTVLELVSVIHTTMSTPILVQVTGLALSTFVSAGSPVLSLPHLINNRTYQIRAPVLTKEVKTFIEGSRPFHKWSLSLSATAADRHIVTSSYTLLEHSPLPERVLLQLADADDSLDCTAKLTETILQETCLDSSQFQEKYCYLQLCSAADRLPHD